MNRAKNRSANYYKCAQCPLRSLQTFSRNATEEIRFIQTFKQGEMRMEAGTVILREGERSGVLLTLLEGWAFRYRSLSNGQRQILSFCLPGDFIGLQEELEGENAQGVDALTDVRFCYFPTDRLHDLHRKFPSLGFDMMRIATHDELIVDENLLSVGRRSAEQRIAMMLVQLYKRAESVGLKAADGSVPFPVTQQHLSDALGLSLAHTSKTLKRLATRGFHRLEDKRLWLLNSKSLRQFADYHMPVLVNRPLI